MKKKVIKPPLPSQCTKMNFEYIRHRATSLIGFFNIADGCLEASYLNQTCTEADFVVDVRTLVNTAPSASWTFVCDGLNTHKSESLVRFVSEGCNLNVELEASQHPSLCGTIQPYRSSF